MKKEYGFLRFALKCIMIPMAAVLVIYCLNKSYLKIDEQKYADILKFGMLGKQYPEVHIGNLGSSHGVCDFDYSAFSESGLLCFNYANTSQTFNYDYAVLQEYGQYMHAGSILFIPVSYFSFNNEVVNDKEAEAMSLRYYHFLSPQNIPDYDPYIDVVAHKLPILSAGKDILKLFPGLNLSLTVFAAENGINPDDYVRWGQERYGRHFDNKEEYFLPERTKELYDILSYCQEREITPVLITPPFSRYYRELISEDFLREFQERVSAIADDMGVSYYDYSHDDRFYDNLSYFSDSDHLNEQGAAYFMEILRAEVLGF